MRISTFLVILFFAHTASLLSMRAHKPKRHKVRNEFQQGDVNDYTLFKKRHHIISLLSKYPGISGYDIKSGQKRLHKGLAFLYSKSHGGFDLSDDHNILISPWADVHLGWSSPADCVYMRDIEISKAIGGDWKLFHINSLDNEPLPAVVEMHETNQHLLDRSIAAEKALLERLKKEFCFKVQKHIPVSALSHIIFGYWHWNSTN